MNQFIQIKWNSMISEKYGIAKRRETRRNANSYFSWYIHRQCN